MRESPGPNEVKFKRDTVVTRRTADPRCARKAAVLSYLIKRQQTSGGWHDSRYRRWPSISQFQSDPWICVWRMFTLDLKSGA